VDVQAAARGRKNLGGGREGKSALSVHSHPFGHSSSISGPDVECDSRRKVGERWERREDKAPGVEAARGRRWKEERGEDSEYPG